MVDGRWICCQLGAREHYAIPRALHLANSLECLITDAWVRPGHPLGAFKPGLRQRFHPDLGNVRVLSANLSSSIFELRARLARASGWPLILQRNAWFQRIVLRHLSKISASQRFNVSGFQPTLFAYSYAALEIFRFAKARGWQTVLGQIDAGPAMQRAISIQNSQQRREDVSQPVPPPNYWQMWREECELADQIVVNSLWSREALAEEGISREKVRVIPLAYEAPAEAVGFQRACPDSFSRQRPLQVLFLGQVNLLKGTMPLVEAAKLLVAEPIEFQFVGPIHIPIGENVRLPNVRWIGPVPRGAVSAYYRDADLFVFPTFSDGFGLTQLEAQAWKLPVIASRFCGDVVRHDENGWLLNEVSAENIAEALRLCLREPERLRRWSENSHVEPRFSLDAIGQQILNL